MATHPYPNLQFWPNSGVMSTTKWAFKDSTFNISAGHDGVGTTEVMYIFWKDLLTVLKNILGYSYVQPRSVGTTPSGNPFLKRNLPWQHPYMNQMFVKNVSQVRGIRNQGNSLSDPDEEFLEAIGIGGAGLGYPTNFGPWSEFYLAELTIQFWRPNYYVRSDTDILVWAGTFAIAQNGLPGGVGQMVGHQHLTRTWYEVPEAAIFGTSSDMTPNGQAQNLVYLQTQVYNPITGYSYFGGPGNGVVGQLPILFSTNMPIGGGAILSFSANLVSGSPIVTVASNVGMTAQGAVCADGTIYDGDMVVCTDATLGLPTGATVISVNGDGIHFTINANATATNTVPMIVISDYDVTKRLFGCKMGTLRFDAVELHERPLQLPPYLMQIPFFSGNEPVSQVQYDVVMHFDLFDPPRPYSSAGTCPTGAARGHNLMPFHGDGLWRPSNFQTNTSGVRAGPKPTPLGYADLTDLFKLQ